MLSRDLETAEQRQTDRAGGSHIIKWSEIIRETESKEREVSSWEAHISPSYLKPGQAG